VKAVLLDQTVIAGLGNIYADESLALARINPARPAASLCRDEVSRLFQAINAVIREAIQHRGTTFRDYRDGENRKGSHQEHLRVYGRRGLPCLECGSLIERTEVAGRGTHFCPRCQQ